MNMRILLPDDELQGIGEGLVPVLPADSRLRPLAAVPVETQNRLRCDLSYLHLAGLVCVYGNVPDDVHLSPVLDARHNGPLRYRLYMMCASDRPTSLEWVEAARAGLDHWWEAGFDDPFEVAQHACGVIDSSYPLRPFAELRHYYLAGLQTLGRQDMFLRLHRHSFAPPGR